MNLFEPYLRIPYLDKGRDHKGCDCWGLIRLIYKEELDVGLPSYGDISAHDAMRITRAVKEGSEVPNIGRWRDLNPTDKMSPFDIVLMKWIGSKVAGHIGIVTDDFKLLHTEEYTGPVIVPMNHPSINRRIVKYARWEYAL